MPRSKIPPPEPDHESHDGIVSGWSAALVLALGLFGIGLVFYALIFMA